jgi:hypothetical protein
MDPPLIPDECYNGFIQAARYPTKQARAKVLLPSIFDLPNGGILAALA